MGPYHRRTTGEIDGYRRCVNGYALLRVRQLQRENAACAYGFSSSSGLAPESWSMCYGRFPEDILVVLPI